jgi:hypothetical protein
MLSEKTTFKEVPRIQRFADLPSLDSLLKDRYGRQERALAIGQACLDFGYTQAQVAAATELHYSTVSRIVGREEKLRLTI